MTVIRFQIAVDSSGPGVGLERYNGSRTKKTPFRQHNILCIVKNVIKNPKHK